MGGEAGLEPDVLENVRRYRAIASLCRQAAAFRPMQKASLLQQAEDWERLAAIELEFGCEGDDTLDEDSAPRDELQGELTDELQAEPQVDTRWWLPRREGLFAGLQA